MKASATNRKVEYSINGRVLEYRTVEEEAQAVQEERNNVVRSDRLRLWDYETTIRHAGLDDDDNGLIKIANVIASARHWESFPKAYTADQVAIAQELHIASRGTDINNFIESATDELLKVMILKDIEELRRSK